MTSLSKSEEQLMLYLWELERAYARDIIDYYVEPKPAMTTIATLLKRIRDKGFIDYKQVGKAREYYPLIKKEDYCKNHFQGMVSSFFSNSHVQLASFFTRTSDMSQEELKELRAMIDQEIKKKQS